MSRFRILVFPLVVLLLLGCSHAVYLPRYEWNAPEYRKPGSYMIRVHGGKHYNTRRFSMTDSTVVIEELLAVDDHYKLMKHDMPIVVPLKDVEYIGVMETDRLMTTAVLIGLGAFVAAIIVLNSLDWSGD